jgi:hypothetical protein
MFVAGPAGVGLSERRLLVAVYLGIAPKGFIKAESDLTVSIYPPSARDIHRYRRLYFSINSPLVKLLQCKLTGLLNRKWNFMRHPHPS